MQSRKAVHLGSLSRALLVCLQNLWILLDILINREGKAFVKLQAEQGLLCLAIYPGASIDSVSGK